MQFEEEVLIQNHPAIVAVGRTKFGEHYEKEPEKLIEEAWLRAAEKVDVERKDLNSCYLSDYFLPFTNKIGLEEGFLSELTELHIPMEAQRSFSAALSNACNAIQAGTYDVVLVGGIEKMTDRWDKIRDDLMLLEDPWSYYAGCTPEANHELMLRAYIREYGLKDEEVEQLHIALAQVAVKNHLHAIKNKYAHFNRKITIDQVLNARKRVSRPLGILDFAPISDGAVTLILTNSKIAKKFTDQPVYILGEASATEYIMFPARSKLSGFLVSEIAMKNALEKAELSVWDLQIIELYDQSTVMEMVALEDMGFCEPGKAWRTISTNCQDYKGFYEINGKKLFVNMDGGLKADGNPLGATGGAQIFEIIAQLRGEAGERQIEGNVKHGCALELVGFGTKGYVHILGRD